jgi:hypothetical protein
MEDQRGVRHGLVGVGCRQTVQIHPEALRAFIDHPVVEEGRLAIAPLIDLQQQYPPTDQVEFLRQQVRARIECRESCVNGVVGWRRHAGSGGPTPAPSQAGEAVWRQCHWRWHADKSVLSKCGKTGGAQV